METKKEPKKPIDSVTVSRMQFVMSGIGLNFSDNELDILIDAVELIEDKDGDVTLDELLQLKSLFILRS